MKKLLLNLCLATAAMLLGGVNSAWAEDEVYSWDSSESAYTDQSNPTIVFNGASVDNLQIYYTQFRDWGSSDGTVKVNSGGKIAFYKFDLSTIKSKLESEGGIITSVTFTFTGKTSDGKDCQKIRALGYNANWSAQTITNSNVSNNAGTILGTVSATGSFQPLDDKAELKVNSQTTHTVNALTYVKSAIASDKDYVSFAITANYTRAGLLNTSATLKVTYSTAARANYTIKYVDEEGTEIKESRTAEGDANAATEIEASDKNDITYNSEKYIYKSDDASEKTIASDNSTVVTITFRKAAIYTYSVKSSLGTAIKSGSAFENDPITYYYPQYELSEGTLYESTKQSSNPYYGKTFTLTTDAQEVTVEYTAKDITNVVYLADAENIEGATASTSGNADIRCSNGKGAFFGEDTEIAKLSAGKYKVYGQVWGNAGATYNIKAGNRTIWTKATVGYLDNASAEFVLSKETGIIIPKAGDANKVLDVIYIQKLADPTEEELAEAATADVKADKAARVFSIVGENVTGGWENDYALTQSTKDGEEDIYTLTLNDFEAWPSTTYEYKLRQNNNWTDYVLPAGDNASFTVDKGGVYKLIFTADVAKHTIDVQTILTKSYTYTASYTNNYNWGAVYAYAWSGEGESKVEQLGAWPGTQLTADANGLYTATILNKVAPEYIIFNANDGNQTADLAFVDGSIYNYDGDKSVSINVTAAGYATYCSTLALDFTAVEGVTAYRAVLDGSSVSFVKVEKVPAGEGILVKANEGKYTVPSIAEADAIVNAFEGVTEPQTIAAGAFVLMNGTSGVGFYKTTKEFTVGANTAYIPAITEARFIGFNFDETTGIDAVESIAAQNGIYNLQGQRVNAATKGLYIVNGKKVLVK